MFFLSEIWFCCDAGALGEEDDDHVLSHTKALMWEGLGHMARRDAVREGDGPAILAYWRLDMLNFWNKGHYKYAFIGHLLLASKYNPKIILVLV